MKINFSQPGQPWEALIRHNAQPGENVEDIFALGLALGQRRANLLHRPFDAFQDIGFALALFCFNPLKPPPSAENHAYLVQNRRKILSVVSKADMNTLLKTMIPDSTLKMGLMQLYQVLYSGDIRNYVNFLEEEPALLVTVGAGQI